MLISILTATYNRSNELQRLYESLIKQKKYNFNWIIINDGSTDDTENLINNYKTENKFFEIEFHKKTNGGKHTAINYGMKIIKSSLVFIVDSDDFLIEDATLVIEKFWLKYRFESSNLSAMWFLQKDQKENIIGSKFRQDEYISTYTKELINSSVRGDKKAVYVTSIRKNYSFPEYSDEKFIGEGIIHKKISNSYKSLFINQAIYVSEYLANGLSDQGKLMRLKNPKGARELCITFLEKDVNIKYRIKKMLLYIIYSSILNLSFRTIYNQVSYKFLFLICYIPAIVICKIWNLKYFKNQLEGPK
jgi:glycosyltransferase involved in cell wall biosynthesis